MKKGVTGPRLGVGRTDRGMDGQMDRCSRMKWKHSSGASKACHQRKVNCAKESRD